MRSGPARRPAPILRPFQGWRRWMIYPICSCSPGRNPFSRGGFSRRQAIRATGIGFVATLAAILTGAGRTALAQPAGGKVPVVDRLSVRIVTDIYTDRYSVPLKTDG